MKKKHLFAAAATLILSAGFTSCSHDFEEYSVSQEVNNTYNQKFIETFGQPATNHDWGFSSSASNARRLHITRAENANGNEWADIKNSTGYGGWLVPDPLTEGQMLRAKAYFQTHPNLTYDDPHWTNFFVQQVYKGATDPGEYSTETVVAANGSTYNSNNMNLMTVGQNAVHINNFNYGDCSVYGNVLDNGSDILAGKTSYHSDKIMLMVDIDDTSCFGYHETGSSNEQNTATGQHNDRAALVAASVIDAWAEQYGNNIGEPVVDEWNRSFLGFDLAIKEGDQIFTDQTQKYTSGMNMGYDGLYYADDNIVYFEYDTNWNRLMPDGMDDEMKDKDGNALRILDANTNFYSGTMRTINDSELRKDVNGKVLVNMVLVNELIQGGYYPVSGSAFKTWVKPTPSYDGYYSDWIVTVTEAQRVDNSGDGDDDDDNDGDDDDDDDDDDDEDTWGEWARIICEDLSVNQATDFDFNDVVFDVRINTAKTKAQIRLKAAGGTLPLTIGWNGEAGTSYTEFEVHNMYDVATNVMVNTHAKNGVDGKADIEKTLTGTFNSYNDIKIMVQKRGEWHEITAHTGQPASKILVKTSYVWCNERRNISDVYNGKTYAKSFDDYVKDPSVSSSWYE